jgi:hypothetical protein
MLLSAMKYRVDNKDTLYDWESEYDMMYLNRNGYKATSAEYLDNMGYYRDSVFVEDVSTGEFVPQVSENTPKSYDYSSILTWDSWSFDTATYQFKKEVIALAPVRKYVKEIGYDDRPNFRVPFIAMNAKPNSSKAIKVKIRYEVPLHDKSILKFIAESDSRIFNKFEESGIHLDMIETTEAPYLSSVSRHILRQYLTYHAWGKGKILYDPVTMKPITIQEAEKALGCRIDTAVFENFETGMLDSVVVKTDINLAQIMSVVFWEEWLIDPQTFNIQKEVIGISPVFWTFDGSAGEGPAHRTMPYVIFLNESKKF